MAGTAGDGGDHVCYPVGVGAGVSGDADGGDAGRIDWSDAHADADSRRPLRRHAAPAPSVHAPAPVPEAGADATSRPVFKQAPPAQ